MESNLPSDLMTPKEARRLLRVDLGTVYRMILSGRLRAWRLGGRYRVSRADVLGLHEPVRVARPVVETRREVRRTQRWVDDVLKRAGMR